MGGDEMTNTIEFGSPNYHRAILGHKVTEFGQLVDGIPIFWFKCECGMEWL